MSDVVYRNEFIQLLLNGKNAFKEQDADDWGDPWENKSESKKKDDLGDPWENKNESKKKDDWGDPWADKR